MIKLNRLLGSYNISFAEPVLLLHSFKDKNRQWDEEYVEMPAREEILVSGITIETINNKHLHMLLQIEHEGKRIAIKIEKNNKYKIEGIDALLDVAAKFDEAKNVDNLLMSLKSKFEIYNDLTFSVSNAIIPYAYNGRGG